MPAASRIGRFEYLVLKAVLAVSDEAYAVPILTELERQASRPVSRGALYTTLGRLEEKEFLLSSLGEATPMRGGRPKRYYRVTAHGVAALRLARDELTAQLHGLKRLIEDAG